MAQPKPVHVTSDRAQAAVGSALRTLEAEGGGIDALSAALRDGPGLRSPLRSISFVGCGGSDRDRHGQIRSRRPQDRFDPCFYGNSRLFRAPRRSQPRRSRNDRQQRRYPGVVVVG